MKLEEEEVRSKQSIALWVEDQVKARWHEQQKVKITDGEKSRRYEQYMVRTVKQMVYDLQLVDG